MNDLARTTALRTAFDLHRAAGGLDVRYGHDADRDVAHAAHTVLVTAETFLAWLHGPTRLHLFPGAVLDQTSGHPTGTPTTGGNTMQIHDNEQFTLSAVTEDAKGFPTADALTWTVDDATIVTLVVADDGQSATIVAGVPGSAVVTVTDGTLTATEAVDVVAGGTALINLSEGPVSVQA